MNETNIQNVNFPNITNVFHLCYEKVSLIKKNIEITFDLFFNHMLVGSPNVCVLHRKGNFGLIVFIKKCVYQGCLSL